MEHSLFEDDIFDQRISPHDRYQFEMKLDYVFNRDWKRQKYLIEAYFFFPSNLGVSPDNYNSDDFYKNIHNYIRFRTPVMSMEQLLDRDSSDSPLSRLEAMVEDMVKNSPGHREDEFLYECKMLACIFKSTLRELVSLAFSHMEKVDNLDDPSLMESDLMKLFEKMSNHCRQLTERFRGLRTRLLAVGISGRVRSTHQLIDEFISLMVESYHHQMLEKIDKIPDSEFRQRLFARVRDVILEEETYRRQRGYLSIIDRESPDNELFLHRHGLIKKFSSRILFLEISRKNLSQRWIHFTYSIAAGIAMLLATVGGFYAQRYFPNFSFSLLVAFVVIYMFKDRTKEIFREIFKKYLQRRFYDRQIQIVDPEKNSSVGKCEEKFSYLKFSSLPEEIQKWRSLDTLPALTVGDRGESIIHYQRSIHLHTKSVFNIHQRVSGFNDILRFNVKHMLLKMDEPYQEVPTVKANSYEISHVKAAKVYHFNVVFCFTVYGTSNNSANVHYQRLRIVLDQKGN